nr:retrovirus-related Pol polyprotein from transposon TNT 1-94 [Tanacetum cinerariifolium]
MLADAKLPVIFWAEAVNTACYVQNKVLVNNSQNKNPYELFNSRTPAVGFLKPFGCHVMILNTLDNLGKFEVKGDKGYFIGYSMSSKAFRVHDALLESSSSKPQDDCSTDVPKSSGNSNPTATSINPPADQLETLTVETSIPTVSSPVPTACFTDSLVPSNILGVSINSDESNGVEANNKKDDKGIVIRNKARLVAQGHTQEEGIDYDEVFAPVARIEAIRLFLAYASFMGFTVYQMDVKSAFLYDTIDEEVYVMQPLGFQDPDFPAKVYKVEKATYGPIGTKWVLKNKKDERGIVIRNKARLVAQGHTQEEGIDYDEVFAPVARIEAIRLFLAYASFMGFSVPDGCEECLPLWHY